MNLYNIFHIQLYIIIFLSMFIHVYNINTGCLEISDKSFAQAEWIKLRRKILYHFIIVAIVNELLYL